MKRTKLLQRGKTMVAQILCMGVLVAGALTSQADPLADGKQAGQEQTSLPAALRSTKTPSLAR